MNSPDSHNAVGVDIGWTDEASKRLERAPLSAIEQSNKTQPWIPQPSQRLLPSVGQLLAALLRLARLG